MNEDKKTRKAPAFQFYADDFLAGTITMTNEERGAYIALLCLQWSKGSLTENDFQRVCIGMPPHSQRICQDKFQIDADGNYRNKRLEAEREKQDQYRKKQTDNANKRWVGNATAYATALPTDMPNVCSPSPSPSPNKKDTKAPTSLWDVGFGVELPESLRTENCLQAVKLWLQHKSERRQAYKKTGLSKALTQWSNEFSAAEFPSIVDHAIASNWAGIFRSKQSQQPSLPMQVASKTVLSTNLADYIS
jgi:uncharacterized protein YdaU (DUF1376 family)